PLPMDSSDQPGVIVRATRPLSGLASGGVYLALVVTNEAVRSYRTLSPLPILRPAVCFLLHCPASYLDWPLTSTLPYEARTFLPRRRVAAPPPAVASPAPTSERRYPTYLGGGGQGLVDAPTKIAADRERFANHFPHVFERVDARTAVVLPLDTDLGDLEAAAARQ